MTSSVGNIQINKIFQAICRPGVYSCLYTVSSHNMVKAKRTSTAKQPDDDTSSLMLDPAEVMRAMMAQKGKAKQEDGRSGSDTEGSDASGSGVDMSDDESDGEERVLNEESEGSEAESSKSAELRYRNRKSIRSPSPVSRIAPSRVKVEREPKSADVKPSPFSEAAKPPAATTFESLGLSKPLISALATINIKKPTEIQAACVGPIMSGRDCIGGAKTGSGKTLAFALPIVERIARDPFGVWAVVLTPTRYVSCHSHRARELTRCLQRTGVPAH